MAGMTDAETWAEFLLVVKDIRGLLQGAVEELHQRRADSPTLGELAMANCSHGEYTYTQFGTKVCRKCGR